MTPEEKFDNKVWEILQKIKEEIIFNNTQEVKWKESKYDPNYKLFNFERGEETVLNKLEKLNAIKIREGIGVLTKLPEINYSNYNDTEVLRLYSNGGISGRYLYLKILQPKFDEIYKKYQYQAKDIEFRDKEVKKWQLSSKDKEKPIHIEIIGRDKIEQHGDKNKAKIKNIADNHPTKKWFSMDNPVIWFIGTIIVAVVSLILSQLSR